MLSESLVNESIDRSIFYFVPVNRMGGLDEMMRIGLYMNDLGLHDTSREMVLSGIKPLPQLEMARDHVSF